MDVNLTVDLGKAVELSRNVACTATVPGVYANLTTNVNPQEPGRIGYGVTMVPGRLVFMLHNFGAAFGSVQRYAYFGIVAEKAFTLKQLQLNIDTDAECSSAQNPVTVAVELSPRDDFRNVTLLGTVMSHHNPQTLSNLTRSQSRQLSAYSGISLAGSTIATTVVYELEPISPTTGAELATSEAFSITYDFNQAATWCRIGNVQSFRAHHNVYALHNSGSAQGRNQRYILVMIATQLPLVLSQVSIPFSTNAAGSGPLNPVTMQVEASPTSDFRSISTLGTINKVNFTAQTTALLPRGISYVRFRATTPIPNGANYVAFKNSIIPRGSVAADGWTQIGVDAKQILTFSNMLFIVNKNNGSLWQYNGVPNSWSRVGDPAYQYIGAESGLYGITAARDHVPRVL
ncbi:hypothetical protein QBC46DRAFT_348042 [Diplogelasinospora grovesii]|uniref:Uncharacterized protein n=1 Tax=Diplogelasinospora grovesii TaxID=303347 RepID=A0AAN6RYM8_9PEZI|nr:hypothetical protein QBC46DRAFT_348042 [Diplogelasinospora grovesii]